MITTHSVAGPLLAGLLFGAAAVSFGQDYNPNEKVLDPVQAVPGVTSASRYAPPDPGAPGTVQRPQGTPPGTVFSTPLPAGDRHFALAAEQGGLFEVATGRYVGENGQSYAVRKAARRMAADHARLGDKLSALASAKGMRLRGGPVPATQAKVDRIEGTPKGRLDNVYVATLVDAHEQDIAAFEKEARDGQDPELRSFAADALPTLRHHLMMLREELNRK